MAIKKGTTKKPQSKKTSRAYEDLQGRSEAGKHDSELFEVFCLWMVLPSIWKGQNSAQLKQKGIDDDELVELLQIKSQRDFAKKFGVHENTMTNWKKKQRERNHLADARVWISRLTGNVVGNLYREASGVKVQPGTFKEYFRVAHELGERVDVSIPEELREALGKLNKLLPD